MQPPFANGGAGVEWEFFVNFLRTRALHIRALPGILLG